MKIVSLENIPNHSEEISNDLSYVYSVCKQMHSLCDELNGIGLSAFQLGIPWKLFVFKDFENKKFRNFLNCDYKNITEKTFDSFEGCLSLPNKNFCVKRYCEIQVVGQELIEENGLKLVPYNQIHKTNHFSNFISMSSIVFQHEIDHQSGRLKMIDKIGKAI